MSLDYPLRKDSVTSATWLGGIFKQSFIDTWNTLQTTVNDAIDNMGLDWFPATVVRDSLKTLNNVLNDLFEPVIGALGQNVGDKVTGKLESDLLDTKNRIEAEFNKLLSDARSTLQNQLNELYGMVDKAKAQVASLESAKNKALAGIEDLDGRVRALEAQKLPFVKVPTLKELLTS